MALRLSDRSFTRATDLLFLVSFLYLALQHWNDILAGGDPWRQGDWLINSLNEPIRRGLFGSALIGLSDLLSLSPFVVLGVLQFALLALLYGVFHRLLRAATDPRTAFLLALSPALFVIFWAGDAQGTMRKELLDFAALSVLALGAIRGSRPLFALGAAGLAAGAFAHEVNILLLPAAILPAILFARARRAWSFVAAAALLVAGAALVAAGYTLSHRSLADARVVCDPLIERGLDAAKLCDGAIAYLETSGAGAVATVHTKAGPAVIALQALLYLGALAPLLFAMRRLRAPGWLYLVSAAYVLPILPLYLIAEDWGRWMGLHVFAIALSVITFAGLHRPAPRPPFRNDALVLALLFPALLITPSHLMGPTLGGWAHAFAVSALNLLH